MFSTSGGISGLQGSKISLISKSEIRYEGYLYSINPEENTVTLRNVRMFGTEGRKDGPQIAPSSSAYEFIIFRGSDIKDLTVFDQHQTQVPQQDPAVLNAWQAPPPASSWGQPKWYSGGGGGGGSGGGGWGRDQEYRGNYRDRDWDHRDYHRDREGYRERNYREDRDYPRRGNRDGYDDSQGWQRNRDNRDRRDNRGPQANRQVVKQTSRPEAQPRDRRTSTHTGQDFQANESAPAKKEFKDDYDFEENNKKLNLEEVSKEFTTKAAEVTESGDAKAQGTFQATKYNKDGFFDEISCEALERKAAGGQRQRMDKDMRQLQKNLDVETFGVTGERAGYGYGPRRGGLRGGRRGFQGRGGGKGGQK